MSSSISGLELLFIHQSLEPSHLWTRRSALKCLCNFTLVVYRILLGVVRSTRVVLLINTFWTAYLYELVKTKSTAVQEYLTSGQVGCEEKQQQKTFGEVMRWGKMLMSVHCSCSLQKCVPLPVACHNSTRQPFKRKVV